MRLFGFETKKKWGYENGFYITSDTTRLAKSIAHYELYKRIVELPGQVVECGVYKGTSLIRFLTYREILESPCSRKIIGFDAFGKFPRQNDEIDEAFIDRFEGAGGVGMSRPELDSVLSYKHFNNYELIEGDIVNTVPHYCVEHPELKIALLHIDVDVYEPSAVILEHMFEKVVPGGVVIFDDYGTVAGETRAVDEFIFRYKLSINKLSLSHIPAYIVK